MLLAMLKPSQFPSSIETIVPVGNVLTVVVAGDEKTFGRLSHINLASTVYSLSA